MMAPNVPAKLKSADISRFALRASQLETARPAIAYWCDYWIVNQLIARGLHTADEECLKYTTALMDKLEQTKTTHALDDAIVDDTAGQAYVELFGLETFERADRAVRADKVTKQTADTFLAASTFLELLNIWGEPNPEIHAKIRYAKWNAVRIAKAIKDGKDPNESNPKPEPAVEEDLQPLDPSDPEVQEFGGGPPMQASVEDVQDDQDHVESRLAAQSAQDQSLHPSEQPSAQPSAQPSPGPAKFEPYPRNGFPYSVATRAENEVSPIEPSPQDRDDSIGGGYFPAVPSDTRTPGLTADSDMDDDPPPPALPSPSHLPPAPPRTMPLPMPRPPPEPPAWHYDTDAAAKPDPPRPAPPRSPLISVPPPPKPPASTLPPEQQQHLGTPLYNTDDAAVAKAQKHARWAISALNFEDADTAVRELRAALQTLGA